eukprot:709761_1
MKKVIVALVLVALAKGGAAASCFDGFEEGKEEAQKLWSGDCYDAMQFDDLCEDILIGGQYASSPYDNWSKKSFKKCAQDGVRDVIQKIQKECIGDDTGMC